MTSEQWDQRQRARSLVDRGLFAEARDLLVPVVQAAPDDADALRLLARAHLGLDDAIRGLQAAHASLMVEPNDPQGHVLVSGAYGDLGRTRDSIEAAQRSVDADPEMWWTWTTYAKALNRDPDQRTDAWLAAMAAVRRAPAEAAVHRAVGEVAQALGWSDKARTAYEAALLLDPTDATTLNNLARLQLVQGDEASAATGFMSAMSADPDSDAAADQLTAMAFRLVRRAQSVALMSAFIIGWSFYAEVPLDLGAWPSAFRWVLGVAVGATMVGLPLSVWRSVPDDVREAWRRSMQVEPALRKGAALAVIASVCVLLAALLPVLPALVMLGTGALVGGGAMLAGFADGSRRG